MNYSFCILFLQFLYLQAQNPEPSPNDCGANCMYVAFRALDSSATIKRLDLYAELSPSGGQVSLEDLKRTALAHGLNATCVLTSPEILNLRSPPFLFIAHMKNDHFVLLSEMSEKEFTVINPPEISRIPIAAFLKTWDGTGILISNAEIASEAAMARLAWLIRFSYGVLYSVILAAVLFAGILAVRWINRTKFAQR